MQDRIARIEETSCTARPDHTLGSSSEMLRLSISRLLFSRKRTLAGDRLGWRIVDQGPLPARNAASASSRGEPTAVGATALFCAPRNHFVALRNFAAADRARSSTLMRDSESKNAFSAVAKIEPTA